MGSIKICQEGARNLAVGIVRQAVVDYTNCVESLAFYNDVQSAYKKITKDHEKAMQRVRKSKRKREYEVLTEEVIEFRRMQKVQMILSEMKQIENFFQSNYYAELCELDSDFMIKTTREKGVSDMVDLLVEKLKKITKKNKDSEKSQKALEEYRRLKLFLESDYLPMFTDKSCDYWLNRIKNETNCMFCDLL